MDTKTLMLLDVLPEKVLVKEELEEELNLLVWEFSMPLEI